MTPTVVPLSDIIQVYFKERGIPYTNANIRKFRQVTKAFNEQVAKELNKGKVFRLPFKLGTLSFRKSVISYKFNANGDLILNQFVVYKVLMRKFNNKEEALSRLRLNPDSTFTMRIAKWFRSRASAKGSLLFNWWFDTRRFKDLFINEAIIW